MTIKAIGNGKIAIDTPYNPKFVSAIKAAGGRWNPGTKCWEADERNIEAVRKIMKDVYGQDDRPVPTVSVRVTVREEMNWHTGPAILFGRIVASARGRDTGAKIGSPGVCFEKGSPTSSGSVKNWYTTIPAGAVIVLHDVPAEMVEKAEADSKYTVDILTQADPQAALKAEREVLLKRLAEIDEILAQ